MGNFFIERSFPTQSAAFAEEPYMVGRLLFYISDVVHDCTIGVFLFVQLPVR